MRPRVLLVQPRARPSLERIFPPINFRVSFLRIHPKEIQKSIDPTKAKYWKLVPIPLWDSPFEPSSSPPCVCSDCVAIACACVRRCAMRLVSPGRLSPPA